VGSLRALHLFATSLAQEFLELDKAAAPAELEPAWEGAPPLA
jgi:hypothetical protein